MRNKSRYADEWKDVIRPDILRRDLYRCTQCKAPQRSIGYYDKNESFIPCDFLMADWARAHGFRMYKIHLQVAHLDNNPANNEYSNLRTLCPRHHLQLDNSHTLLIRRRGN